MGPDHASSPNAPGAPDDLGTAEPSTSHARGKHENPWVQPILVSKTGMHEPTIEVAAAASAALRVRYPHLESWDQWLAGPFAKTTRRASFADIDKAISWADDHGVRYQTFSAPFPDATHESMAVAFEPMTYASMPKVIAKAQVADTELARRTDEAAEEVPRRLGEVPQTVQVLLDETLSTGKACAQAAHAVWLWVLAAEKTAAGQMRLEDWENAHHPVAALTVEPALLARIATTAHAHAIADAGLTEVAPGSLTCVAFGPEENTL